MDSNDGVKNEQFVSYVTEPDYCSPIGWEEGGPGSYGNLWYILFVVHAFLQVILAFRDWRRDLKCSSCSR